MDLLFKHNQVKKDRKGLANSICDLKLFGNEEFIYYVANFNLEYSRYGSKKSVSFEHSLNISLLNGDIVVTYKIINDNLTEENIYKSSFKSKKNDFKMLNDLIENGLIRGEKRLNYWGVKYERSITEIILIITNKLKTKFNTIDLISKSYKEKPSVNQLYDLIVDYHLSQKGIKGHDNVYFDIMDLYPAKKFLKRNDNKFLPSVLDSLGIKSKFLIKELNVSELPINIPAVNYFCKLFGDNYLDYLKKINWKDHCVETRIPKVKPVVLKNDSEKNSFIKLINTWNSSSTNLDCVFTGLNKLLKLRSDLESKNVFINLTPKNDNQYNALIEKLISLKQYYQRGYKLRYIHPQDFINHIEEDITMDGETFKLKVLKSEDDFINEGIFMKNCMSKQFSNGSLYVYLRGTIKNKHINVQYRKGSLVQSYGKSNSPVPSIFLPFVDILNEKFKKYQNITWTKEKYDYLIN